MIFKRLKYLKELKKNKNQYYQLIKDKNTSEMKKLFDSEVFYNFPKKYIFRYIHFCSSSSDAFFRNEIVDFLLSNKRYLEFAIKHVKNFPLDAEGKEINS
ncbi:MAG: hypothetical protein S4CHLAM6_03610 [Chlamydiae bacterium]|nr:hypothetical protein [Chlamydiota bacterium]